MFRLATDADFQGRLYRALFLKLPTWISCALRMWDCELHPTQMSLLGPRRKDASF
jgi:hypothetical protein